MTSLPALAGSAGWGDLSSWKDSYPVRDNDKHRQAILEDPAVRGALGRLLAPDDVLRVASYTLGLKNDLVDGFLIVSRCRPHDCGSENALVILEQASDHIWVRLNEVTDRAISTRWYGNHSSFTQLPEQVKAKAAEKYNAS